MDRGLGIEYNCSFCSVISDTRWASLILSARRNSDLACLLGDQYIYNTQHIWEKNNFSKREDGTISKQILVVGPRQQGNRLDVDLILVAQTCLPLPGIMEARRAVARHTSREHHLPGLQYE